jgi:hypothetical protein
MRRIINFIFVLSVFVIHVHSQCVKNISTNPDNPINNEFIPLYQQYHGGNYTINPYLNTFDWQDPTANIYIDLDAIWATGYGFRTFELRFIGKYPTIS